jgi:hypothetical protein
MKSALGYGFEEATIVGLKAPGFKEFWKSGLKTVIDILVPFYLQVVFLI